MERSVIVESKLSYRITRMLTLGTASWIAFWACAPPATLPAPIPLGRNDGVELGIGAASSFVSRQDCRYDNGPVDTANLSEPVCEVNPHVLPDMLHWGLFGVTDQVALGWRTSIGAGTPGIAAGAVARWDWTEGANSLVGPQLEVGIAWASLSFPVSYQVKERMWVYTQPSVGLRQNGTATLPIGLGLPLGRRLRLDIEGGIAGPFRPDALSVFDSYGSYRTWASAGIAFRPKSQAP